MLAQAFGRRCNGGRGNLLFSFFILKSPLSTTADEASRVTTVCLSKYLTESLGFSREESVSTAAKVTRFTSTTKPILVVDLLKKLGLDSTQIKKCVLKYPRLLYYDVETNLNPKIQCLQEFGLSGSDLANILERGGKFLERRLDSNLKPNLTLLKLLFRNDEEVCRRMIKAYPSLLRYNCEDLQGIISYFQKLGFPNEKIKWFMFKRPRTFRFPPQWFEEKVHLLEKDFGIPRDSPLLLHGLCAVGSASKLTTGKKCAVFRSFGWSNSDIITLFQHQPFCFALSEVNIRKKLDFLMNKLGYKPDFLSTRSALTYSLEKRILPRVYVMETLKEKKLFVRKRCVYSVLCLSEKNFEEMFLLPYKDEVPDLYESYKRRVKR